MYHNLISNSREMEQEQAEKQQQLKELQLLTISNNSSNFKFDSKDFLFLSIFLIMIVNWIGILVTILSHHRIVLESSKCAN